MEKIPLCRAHIEKEEFEAVENVLKSGWLTHGPKTTEFENAMASFLGVKHAIAMNSCTSCLFLALVANDIKGEVLVPSFTFVASANAIVTAGAQPVFVDVNYDDCNINPDLLEDYVTPKTEAIMVVHFAGQCCEMDKIERFAQKHNLLLIEDSAETLGGTFNGKMGGAWGIGCFSFFPTKNITTGEGGILTTNSSELNSKIRALIGHGIEKSTLSRQQETHNWQRSAIYPGYNFRLSNVLATIGVEQMKKINTFNLSRQDKSKYLIQQLSDIDEIDLPYEKPNCRHVYQMFTIKVKHNRDKLVEFLRGNGIEASVHFDPPVHLQPAYANHRNSNLPITEKLCTSILTLPMFPDIEMEDLNQITHFIKSWISNG